MPSLLGTDLCIIKFFEQMDVYADVAFTVGRRGPAGGEGSCGLQEKDTGSGQRRGYGDREGACQGVSSLLE